MVHLHVRVHVQSFVCVLVLKMEAGCFVCVRMCKVEREGGGGDVVRAAIMCGTVHCDEVRYAR